MPPPRIHPPPIIEIDGEGLTPELRDRVLDVQIKNEEKKIEHEINDNWTCCCLSNRPTDSRLVKYLFQMSIIIAIISLAIAKLSNHNLDCNQTNVYVGLISLMVGIVLPSPNGGSSKK